MMEHVNIKVGINPQVFNAIKQEVSGWNKSKKMCSIIFDEMKLKTGVRYTKKDVKIHGFVESTEKPNHFADHALIFILKGAVYEWQQPIAFYFSEGAASGPQIKAILKELVAAVCETGLQPIALISNQGTSFQRALESLQEDTRRSQILAEEETDDTIHLSGQCLSVVYDPPHLLKDVRNNFLTKNIQMDGKTSKWQDLVEVYRADSRGAGPRVLCKLNDEDILPDKINKIEVKNCVRVFSKTMAGILSFTTCFSHYPDGTPLSTTLLNTAKLLTFLDDLIDSVTGPSADRPRTRRKPLRTDVTRHTQHHAFWTNAIKKIEDIKFVDQQGELTSVPSLKNWVTTLKSYQRLWQVLRKKKIQTMRQSYFNTDAVENFFDRVRSYNDSNDDPTCYDFASIFQSLLVTTTSNCTEQVLNMKSLLYQSAEVTSVADGHTSADSVHAVPSSPSSRTECDAGTERIQIRIV